MTPLGRRILARIRATGPITLADYMAEALGHYYRSRDPLGARGDFTTAPEISQMFGELLGLWLAQAWLDQGAPRPFALAELGPGRGTLMADALRATARVPGFHAALRLHLVEISPALRTRQRAALPGRDIAWHDTADSLPQAPLFVVANEFFDALPIRQFRRCGPGWQEVMVAESDGRLAFALAAPLPLAALAHRLGDTRDGDIVEICPAAPPIMAALAGRIRAHGGAALVIDYGGWRSRGDTLQALAGHAFTAPLAAPGEADLTAHVDFEPLAAQPGLRAGFTTQGALLLGLGLAQRTRALAEKLHGPALESHLDASRRLTDPTRMGSLFKALALTPAGAPPPPGFIAGRGKNSDGDPD